MTKLDFQEFPKIPRLKREVVITEKIDGTNAQVALIALDSEELLEAAGKDPFCLCVVAGKQPGDSALALYVGSRNRWLTPEKDNFGFCAWVLDHADELESLDEGHHFGEWYGRGIGRNYGLLDRRFALFNTALWGAHNPNTPAICQVVPVLARGEGADDDAVMDSLHQNGSVLVPRYGNPEGIVIWHSASRQLYKRTFEHDGGKWVKS